MLANPSTVRQDALDAELRAELEARAGELARAAPNLKAVEQFEAVRVRRPGSHWDPTGWHTHQSVWSVAAEVLEPRRAREIRFVIGSLPGRKSGCESCQVLGMHHWVDSGCDDEYKSNSPLCQLLGTMRGAAVWRTKPCEVGQRRNFDPLKECLLLFWYM